MVIKKEHKLKAKFIAIGLVVGLILGIIGTLFIQNYNPKDENAFNNSPSVVFDRIIAQNELVCASQMYNITNKASNINSFFGLFDIPFTDNSFWYRYVGTIKVGIDLKQAAYNTEESVITISLDQPIIISNTPDMDQSGILEENNNIFNPIHVKDVDAFQRQCIEESQIKILEGGIMDEARQNAEQNISDMFYAALGDAYTVEFQWREAE